MYKIIAKVLMVCGLTVSIQPVVFAEYPDGFLLANGATQNTENTIYTLCYQAFI